MNIMKIIAVTAAPRANRSSTLRKSTAASYSHFSKLRCRRSRATPPAASVCPAS